MNMPINNTGWVKFYRSLLDWEWWGDRNTRDLFMYCLLKANHKSTNWRGRTIEAGQFITTIRTMAPESGLTVREVRTALNHLLSTHELTQETTHGYTIITVSNYEKYQATETPIDTIEDTSNDMPPTHDRHTTDTQNKNDKNIEEEKDNNIPPYNPPTEEKPKRTRKQFVIPTVEEVAAYCAERKNNIDAQYFVDFYTSKGWMVGSNHMKDWKSAVRTWEAKRKQQSTPTPANNPAGILLGPGEFIRQDGSRTYGTGIVTVPQSAPPRPNERCTWSSQYNNWIM